ncbi:phosphatase PAP2 family protein [Acinetobacter apis]|uniref:undecaprenyl-diphosphate phosphatase n=1 Tax=Acinetobacter apis TaxID=1229165 RepID=A0A217EH75_9GAMM|nr:phosphatase PAP2 family protein [Acinetobacter apis]SNQ29853.1 undecaprenyl-diphosphatase [Acinetobacter apis]
MLQTLIIKIQALDLKGCIYLNQLSRNHHVALFFKLISRLGDGTFWFAILCLIYLSQPKSYYIQVMYLASASFLTTLLYKALKHKTTRPRPYQVHQVIILGERPLDHFSFPSGHTLHAVISTIVFGYIQPALLLIMLPFTVLVAISRMVLGLHYPTDVLVGALLGTLLSFGVIGFASYAQILL